MSDIYPVFDSEQGEKSTPSLEVASRYTTMVFRETRKVYLCDAVCSG